VLRTDALPGAAAPGEPVTIGIRPEHLRLRAEGDAGNLLAADVGHVEYLGDQTVIYAAVPGAAAPVALKHAAQADIPQPGSRIALHLPARHCLVFDGGGRALPRTAR